MNKEKFTHLIINSLRQEVEKSMGITAQDYWEDLENTLLKMNLPLPHKPKLSQRFYTIDQEVRAFEILFGLEWKKQWSDASKAADMYSIRRGDIQPCVPFDRWVELVEYYKSLHDECNQ